MRKENGYLTVCICVCLPVILSLCIALIEGARRNAERLESMCICETSLQSVMSEYHQVLREQYDIFAIDTSYGSPQSGREKVEARLHYYVKGNIETNQDARYFLRRFVSLSTGLESVGRVTLLSDECGGVFRTLAIESFWEDSDLQILNQLKNWVETVEVNGMEQGREETARKQVDREFSEYRNQYPEVEIRDPSEQVNNTRRKGILNFVTEIEKLSDKSLIMENCVSRRIQEGRVSEGNMSLAEATTIPGMERFLFQRYLSDRMGSYVSVGDKRALDYEQEYLVAGKASDVQNLKSVVHRLLCLREASNMLYLWNCPEKRSEVLIMAEAISAAILMPELIPVIEMSILLGWAYGESVSDVKTLLKGGKVPLLKEDSDWKTDINAALNNSGDSVNVQERGLSYEDYLAVFMLLEKEDVLSMRAMDLVEANIRKTRGNGAFRLDACYVALVVDIRLHGANGQQYEYQRYRRY